MSDDTEGKTVTLGRKFRVEEGLSKSEGGAVGGHRSSLLAGLRSENWSKLKTGPAAKKTVERSKCFRSDRRIHGIVDRPEREALLSDPCDSR